MHYTLEAGVLKSPIIFPTKHLALSFTYMTQEKWAPLEASWPVKKRVKAVRLDCISTQQGRWKHNINWIQCCGLSIALCRTRENFLISLLSNRKVLGSLIDFPHTETSLTSSFWDIGEALCNPSFPPPAPRYFSWPIGWNLQLLVSLKPSRTKCRILVTKIVLANEVILVINQW